MEELIHFLNLTDVAIAQRVLEIQQRAYRVEADLIGFDGIPPLHETLDALQQSTESFIGYFVEDVLAGVLSYSIADSTLDIGRLVVHPDYLRRGIGKALVEKVGKVANVERLIVSTGALNTPARQLYERLDYQLIEEVLVLDSLIMAHYEKLNKRS